MRGAIVTAGLLLASARAQADVDWSKGLVTARGVGLADRQAPNPAVARGPARRKAEDAAKLALGAELPALPLATGGTLATKLGDPAIKARIDRAIARAIVVTADPETDGSWRVTVALPIEAIRQALAGPRVLPDTGDAVAPAIVVEGVTAKPAVGMIVAGLAAPTIWVSAVPAWAKDAPRIKATSVKDGVIQAKAPKASKVSEATLFVIVSAK